MSKIANSTNNSQKVVVKQPLPVLKQKRKFTNKTTRPSVHFDSSHRIKDENGNVILEPSKSNSST
jgi:hypothetical protein